MRRVNSETSGTSTSPSSMAKEPGVDRGLEQHVVTKAAPKEKPVMLLTSCKTDRPTPVAKLTQQAVRVVRFQNRP